jgi:hypothetical protein
MGLDATVYCNCIGIGLLWVEDEGCEFSSTFDAHASRYILILPESILKAVHEQ